MAVLQMDALASIPNDEIDALSSDDESESSHDDFHKGPKTQVTDYEGFEKGFDADDPIAKQMETILSLKISLGIDNDKEFLAEHERKKAQLEKERLEKEREAERVANMTPEERIEYESQKASSLFSNVAQKVMSRRQEEIKKEYAWEKPEWAKKKTLRTTAAGQAVKKGADLQGPITQAPHLKKNNVEEEEEPKPKLKHREAEKATKKNIEWEKPDWAKKTKLKTTAAGEAVKKGVDLQAPITQAPHIKKDSKPEEQAPTRKLKAAKEAEAVPKKNIEWEKPDWAKKNKLRTTAAGEAVKNGVDLQGPITQAPHIKKDTQAEVMDFLKKNVKKAAPTDSTQAEVMDFLKRNVKKTKEPKSPTKGPKSPTKPVNSDTQAEVMDFLKKNMKKAKA